VASRLRMLGLDVAPVLPLHFVVQGELQRALPGILLRRTADLPPADDVGVIPAAALLAYCRRATTIDAIAVGDWLLERHHLDSDVLGSLVAGQPWRDGAAEAAWVLEHLVDGSRSLPESKARVMIGFAGLPTPEPNAPEALGDVVVRADLWFPAYRCAGEYEGEQHHRERARYVAGCMRRWSTAGTTAPRPTSGQVGIVWSPGSATSYPASVAPFGWIATVSGAETVEGPPPRT
jgi:hypothetical protein